MRVMRRSLEEWQAVPAREVSRQGVAGMLAVGAGDDGDRAVRKGIGEEG
jgi:hypothetical protein